MKYNHTLKKINFFDNQLTNNIGNAFIEILHTNKTLRIINLFLNRIQLRIIDEINRILKINVEKEKAKYVPDLHKSVKNLKFNPEMFKFYEKSIRYKKLMQSDLYKKLKQDDKHFSKLINVENKKINIKVNQKLSIDSKITKTQNEIKDILQNLGELEEGLFEQEKEFEKKMEAEKKLFKKYKDENELLTIEYNATKKSYDDIIKETLKKQQKVQEKLNIAQIAVNSKLKEINKRREILSQLYDPDMLRPIKNESNNNQIEMIKERLKKQGMSFMKKSTFNYSSFNNFNNLTSEQNNTVISTTTNENILTTNSGNIDKNSIKKSILKKSIKEKNKK